MAKSISIGRDPACDICIPSSFNTVSNRHADIELDEYSSELFFIDHSSNGTLINGEKIRGQRRHISQGDNIRLANAYVLSWHEIMLFFPKKNAQTVLVDVSAPRSRQTQSHNTPIDFSRLEKIVSEEKVKDHNHPDSTDFIEIERCKRKWSWSAFILGWIWGVGHRCWWPLFSCLCAGFITGILMVAAPVVGSVLSSLLNIAYLGLAIYLGMKGNSIAWRNGCFENTAHFNEKERQWNIAAFIVLGLYILAILIILVSLYSVINTY